MATLIGSFLPGPAKTRLGTHPYEPKENHVQLGHRFYHLAAFGCIALVYLLRADGIREEMKVVLYVLTLGLSIESAQYFGGLSEVFEWWDVRDDLIAAAGVFAFLQIAHRMSARITR
jgi:hypothetical protein